MTPIALLTDFGTSDGYVAAMKGVILGIIPDVTLIDITHDVAPQSIDQGAYLLGTVAPYLPPRVVVIAVVDPGVGTDRPAVAGTWTGGAWVGPDNGLWHDFLGLSDDPSDQPPDAPARVAKLPPGCRAVHLTNSAYWRPEVSPTFHGRDIFAPVGAHLARGVPLDELGPPVQELIGLPPLWERRGTGRIAGRVRHIDHFGNIVTSVPVDALGGADDWITQIAGRQLRGLKRTYGEAQSGDLLVLAGSSGQVEIAVSGGNAAQTLHVAVGAPVELEREER